MTPFRSPFRVFLWEDSWLNWSLVTTVVYFVGVSALFVRIIMSRRPVSVSLAWLLFIFFIPVAGPIFYLLLGELHTTQRKIDLQDARYSTLSRQLSDLSAKYGRAFDKLNGAALSMARFLNNIKNSPPLSGNRLEIYDKSLEVLDIFISEVRNAKESCNLLYYIYANGGKVDELSLALMDAAKRGVKVRLLVDSVGSSEFIGSPTYKDMLKSGIEIKVALAVGFIRMWFQRIDIRNHRKIFVIDNRIAFTGSQNIADPRTFKKDSNVSRISFRE